MLANKKAVDLNQDDYKNIDLTYQVKDILTRLVKAAPSIQDAKQKEKAIEILNLCKQDVKNPET